MRLRTVFTLILITIISVGCTTEARPTSTPTPADSATPPPIETTTSLPTPHVEVVIQDLIWFPSVDDGGYYVIGTLENQSKEQIDSISIHISIFDTAEKLV